MKDRYALGYVLFGCALAAKLQAVIAVPVLLIFWWKRRDHSLAYWLLIPVTMELLLVPAMLVGFSPLVTLQLYTSQTDEYHMLYQWYPNIWALLQGASYWVCAKVGILLAVGALAMIMFAITKYCRGIDKDNYPLLAVWITMTPLLLLPALHERYGLFLEMLSILLAIKDKRYTVASVALNIMAAYFYIYASRAFIPEAGKDPMVYITGAIYLLIYFGVNANVFAKMQRGEI